MLDDSLVPEAISVINDRQETLLLLFYKKEWWVKHISEAMAIVSPGTHHGQRQTVPDDAISMLHPDDNQHAIGQATLCLDPANNRWWVEGIDKKEGGCYFLSDTIHWNDLFKEKTA